MAKKEKYKPEEIVAALNENKGLVYMTADKLGVVASTIYRAAARHPTVKAAMEHQKGKRLDTAESKLWDAVEAGEGWAICFYLKTQGRVRGYIEKASEFELAEMISKMKEEQAKFVAMVDTMRRGKTGLGGASAKS